MIYTKEFIRKLAIKNGILTGVSPIINDFIEFYLKFDIILYKIFYRR